MICNANLHETLLIEFDNFGAVMSVSEDLLCAFELLKVSTVLDRISLGGFVLTIFLQQPLDGQALKKEMAKTKRRR